MWAILFLLFNLRNYPLTALGKSGLLMLHKEILLVQSEYQSKTSDVFKWASNQCWNTMRISNWTSCQCWNTICISMFLSCVQCIYRFYFLVSWSIVSITVHLFIKVLRVYERQASWAKPNVFQGLRTLCLITLRFNTAR